MYTYQNKYTLDLIKDTDKVLVNGKKVTALSGLLNKIIREIAVELNLDIKEVSTMIKAMFKFTDVVFKNIPKGTFGKIDSGNMPIIRYKYFGKFILSDYRVKQMVRNLKKKKENAEHRSE